MENIKMNLFNFTENFKLGLTVAMAEALASTLEELKIPKEQWKEVTESFSLTFQKSLARVMTELSKKEGD